jgi:polar amino acid transport system permease protein
LRLSGVPKDPVFWATVGLILSYSAYVSVRRVIPPLLNDFIALQKETSLVSVIGPIDAVRQAGIYTAREFNFTSYVAAALIFLALTIPQTRFTDWLLNRQRVRISGSRLA